MAQVGVVVARRELLRLLAVPVLKAFSLLPIQTEEREKRAMGSFHVYPSAVQSFAPYDRSQPLACDVVEFDTTGGFDPVNHCFVAQHDCIMEFHATILWHAPPQNAFLVLLLTKNTLPPPGGSPGGEVCGDDVVATQPGNTNIACRITRKLALKAGDKVWAVPCINSGGSVTNAVAGNGANTCNYFEGHEIS